MKTQTSITTQQALQALARLNDIMTQTSQAAYEIGARNIENHAARKADNKIRRKLHNGLFVEFKVIQREVPVILMRGTVYPSQQEWEAVMRNFPYNTPKVQLVTVQHNKRFAISGKVPTQRPKEPCN